MEPGQKSLDTLPDLIYTVIKQLWETPFGLLGYVRFHTPDSQASDFANRAHFGAWEVSMSTTNPNAKAALKNEGNIPRGGGR